MAEMLFIIENIALPIILMIAAGFVFQKIFKTDIRTFTKVNMYVLVPVVVFVKLLDADVSGQFFAEVIPYVLLLQTGMYLLALLISAILRFTRSMRGALTNSLVLINTGNYGLPLIDLVFKDSPIPMALDIANASQILIIAIQNITSSTFSIFQACAGAEGRKRALTSMFKMPVIYVILAVIVIRLCNLTIPQPIMIPLGYLSNAFVAMALIALGVQLANIRLGYRLGTVLLVSIIKIILTPLAGFALVTLFGIKGVLGAALIIGLSTPTAVTSAVIAQEFNNEPEFAAQVVFVTTVLCTFTLPFVIMFVKSYFGIA